MIVGRMREMMGPSHALSGAAVWLAGSLALDQFAGYEQSPLAIAVGTAVCAGGALFPDLDLSGKVTRNQGGATVARTFGVVSLFVAEVIEKLSLGVYHATKLSKDPHRKNGHRTLTHTLPFTALVGWGTTSLCAAYGKWAVIGILFDQWAKRAGWVVVTLLSAGAAYFTYLNLPGDRGYPMIGLAMAVGCLVHILGDMITSNGVPLLWPIPIKRRMWTMISVPKRMTVKVGGQVEVVVLRGVFTAIAVLSAIGLAVPSLLRRIGLGG
jgi:membrane-bound metal-dependent hydrolase YbcI (DUF457 family)